LAWAVVYQSAQVLVWEALWGWDQLWERQVKAFPVVDNQQARPFGRKQPKIRYYTPKLQSKHQLTPCVPQPSSSFVPFYDMIQQNTALV